MKLQEWKFEKAVFYSTLDREEDIYEAVLQTKTPEDALRDEFECRSDPHMYRSEDREKMLAKPYVIYSYHHSRTSQRAAAEAMALASADSIYELEAFNEEDLSSKTRANRDELAKSIEPIILEHLIETGMDYAVAMDEEQRNRIAGDQYVAGENRTYSAEEVRAILAKEAK
jgi:hypothetical protein